VSDRQKIKALQKMIDDAGIEHFSARELGRLNANAWSGDSFELPDADHLERIIPTLKLADEIRERWCAPVLVVSGYRPPAYNRRIGGSPQSQHMRFKALDLKPVADFDLRAFFDTASTVVETWRARGLNVGFGRYFDGHGRFIHIDTSAHTGIHRDWQQKDET